MEIVRIVESHLIEKTLLFIGGSFFSGERLQKFIQNETAVISTKSRIDLPSLSAGSNRITELWAILENDNLLGGMTLNYYLWEKLSKQLYFFPHENKEGKFETIAIKSFSELVSQNFNAIPQIAVELGYYAVSENARGQGIGRKLFETFIQQVDSTPVETKLLFTIVLGKYSKTPLGDTLMKHLLRHGIEAAEKQVNLQSTLNELGHPTDIFEADSGAVPTARLAKNNGFLALGYGRYLGQLWGKVA
jgi:GNAT superfamily N-acetyltransferase